MDHLSVYVEHQVDKDNRLSNLFWADEKVRRDYMAFGDMLSFDTTYKTIMYNKCLTILLGVNHHFDTCIFGFVLLLDETSDTFCWLMIVFLACMNGQKLAVVLIDGDLTMRARITKFLLDTTSRLWAWHLGNNSTQKVKKTKVQCRPLRINL